jgi:hypothetical protein
MTAVDFCRHFVGFLLIWILLPVELDPSVIIAHSQMAIRSWQMLDHVKKLLLTMPV